MSVGAKVFTRLSESDRTSPVWMRFREQLEARLETLRTNNDQPLDHEATAFLRGQIAELKLMLRLDKPDPLIPD